MWLGAAEAYGCGGIEGGDGDVDLVALKLLMVWAKTSFNGLVLLLGLIWFGGK